jgi:hypothetical protein
LDKNLWTLMALTMGIYMDKDFDRLKLKWASTYD